MTHLFDAVRFADHANELEESARNVEGDLQEGLNKLEALTEEATNILGAMKVEKEAAIRELAQQVEGFLLTAKEQAVGRIQKGAKQKLEDFRRDVSGEKDKAIKSLEAFFASDPLPVVESSVQVRLSEGLYEARSSCECEGGIKYDFRLAAQNSKIFHQPLLLSQLGYELRVPVRFSRAVLSRSRTPGFERLDQYTLSDAEASGGKLRANFVKEGNGASLKVVTSGAQENGFVGLEYSDQVHAVNVMNDPSLMAFVDIEAIRKAAGELVAELNELAKRKVAILRLSVNGEQSLEDVNSREILQKVMGVMGSKYREVIQKVATGVPRAGEEELDMDYLKGRLRLLGGDLSKSISQGLGRVSTQ